MPARISAPFHKYCRPLSAGPRAGPAPASFQGSGAAFAHPEALLAQRKRTVAKIIVVTSGKGGVGKTTTSAAFSTALALKGFKTVVIDFDVGLRNLDLVMGCERRV